MNSLTAVILIVVVLFYTVAITGFVLLYLSVKRDVEEALKHATPAEQAKIRKALVKTMFPPRFYK